MPAFSDMWTGKTIGAALAEASGHFGSRVGWIFENGSVTYEGLMETSGLVARGLLALGVKRGDKVAVWLAGYSEWAPLYFGIVRIGAVIVPVNTRYKSFEIEYVLHKSKATMLIFKDEGASGKNYAAILNEIAPELDGAQPGRLRLSRLPHLSHVVCVDETRLWSGCSTLAGLMKAGSGVSASALALAESKVTPEDDALIQFTSGTTALPKGALLYQNAMLRGSYYNNYLLGVTEGANFFSPQPFYHAGGSIQVMLGPVVCGCTVIVQTYFSPEGALHLMEKHKCTVTMGHQPHFIEYLNYPDLKKLNLCLERADIFAPPDIRKRVHEEMGIAFLNSPYGMTETHLGGTSCQVGDPPEKWMNTVGRCMPGIELGIRDREDGTLLPAGKTGEACFRGWAVMKGYYDEPEMTAEVLDKKGWLRTGDLAVVDEEGYVRLVGRLKDMIRVGGENVAASDVEEYLLGHEKVKQAVAVGAPERRLGEVVVAFVELKAGNEATEEEIVSYCRGGLASFKVPRRVIFVTEWPLSGTGKIQKVALKEQAEGYMSKGAR